MQNSVMTQPQVKTTETQSVSVKQKAVFIENEYAATDSLALTGGCASITMKSMAVTGIQDCMLFIT